MRNFLTDICDFVFPRVCMFCGDSLLKEEQYICTSCLIALPRTNMHLVQGNEIERNFWGKMNVVRASSFFYYSKGGDVREILYELKYHGNRQIGRALGRIMAGELSVSGFFNNIDCIIPVPLHPKKLRRRGYNQSEWLCKGLSDITSIPIENNIIKRTNSTETQTHKSRFERWDNVSSAFVCNNPAALDDKHILLVDDVLTTGATLVSCADALNEVKGLQISLLTLAIAIE